MGWSDRQSLILWPVQLKIEISVSAAFTDKAAGHLIAQESNMCTEVMEYSPQPRFL